ncbi:putative OPA3-like protein CG43998 [Drosophila busckii]|uniref:putative OPA3-like protein CG43998 n=1 Tax=Drosophila busckii TaxID=30019 RepID=UPI001432AE85|nr:putative OPA3-like protein CG43998 [Drosophila busckii]
MVIGAYPIGKITLLGLKQIATPVSKVVKQIAKTNPLFKTLICIPTGQLVHKLEVRLKMRMLRLPQPKRIPKLTDSMATDLGANLMAEVFVISLSVYLLFFELSRQAEKDRKKHEKHHKRKELLDDQISTLHKQLDWQERELKEINRLILERKTRCECE